MTKTTVGILCEGGRDRGRWDRTECAYVHEVSHGTFTEVLEKSREHLHVPEEGLRVFEGHGGHDVVVGDPPAPRGVERFVAPVKLAKGDLVLEADFEFCSYLRRRGVALV